MKPLDRVLSWVVNRLLAWMVRRAEAQLKEIQSMSFSPELQKLVDAVNANQDVVASGVALIQGLSAQLQAAKNDPAEIQKLADQLSSQSSALAAAIAQNTVAQPGANAIPNTAAPGATTGSVAQPSGSPVPPTPTDGSQGS